MKITNTHNLPQSIVNALTYGQRKPLPDRMSVTDLIAPPQIRQLKIQYWDYLSEDVSDRLWLLLGKAVHVVLEHGAPEGSEAEQKLTTEMGGFTLVCISDLLHGTELADYKITSVYSFLLNNNKAKDEWAQQLNCNAYILARNGRTVESLKIHAILRDWKQSEAIKAVLTGDYPPIPFQSISVPLWTLEGQERYIKARLEAHKALNPQCSTEERWLRGEKWAVYKNNNKKAFKLFDTEEEAQKLIAAVGPDETLRLEYRQGSYNRCKQFCIVSDYCPQWQAEKEKNQC